MLLQDIVQGAKHHEYRERLDHEGDAAHTVPGSPGGFVCGPGGVEVGHQRYQRGHERQHGKEVAEVAGK